MAIRGKAVAVLLGTIVLLGGGIAMAAGDKKKKPTPSPEPDEADEVEVDEEEDVEVVLPNDAGEPNKGPVVKVDADDAEDESNKDAEEVLPEDPQTDLDDKLDVIADDEGKSKDEAIKEVVDEVTGGEPAIPLALEETSEEMDPKGTVKLARLMLARETLPNWKEDDLDGDIGAWQEELGLKPDNKFGIKSAAVMAEEVGVLPLIRYWPTGTVSKADAEKQYDAAISNVILTKLKPELPDSQAHIDALTASMNREVAVSYGNSNPPPQKTREFALAVNEGIAEGAELKGEQELKNA